MALTGEGDLGSTPSVTTLTILLVGTVGRSEAVGSIRGQWCPTCRGFVGISMASVSTTVTVGPYDIETKTVASLLLLRFVLCWRSKLLPDLHPEFLDECQ